MGCLADLAGCGCGRPGRLYTGMCVHEHLLHDVPVEVCAEHAREEWECVPCAEADGHECLFMLAAVDLWQRVT